MIVFIPYRTKIVVLQNKGKKKSSGGCVGGFHSFSFLIDSLHVGKPSHALTVIKVKPELVPIQCEGCGMNWGWIKQRCAPHQPIESVGV